ncbi:unnamed protein product [Onchocerca flexuosa]|uniref:Uncharacterized protein n=1 Tax=Onchocerca flexuosa TaxID=387005 RepID=A0A183HHL7_9BILA|nr:unnamed protein product [Onchocerca flexuosa]
MPRHHVATSRDMQRSRGRQREREMGEGQRDVSPIAIDSVPEPEWVVSSGGARQRCGRAGAGAKHAVKLQHAKSPYPAVVLYPGYYMWYACACLHSFGVTNSCLHIQHMKMKCALFDDDGVKCFDG